MIQNVMQRGFRGICGKRIYENGKFDTAEIRKLFMTNMTFSTIFDLIDYFLI